MGFVELVQSFFESVFGNAYLVGFIISMIPLIELKGGIIYMIVQTENVFLSFLVGVLGSSVVAPVLLLIFIPLIRWMKSTKIFRKIATVVENYFKKKSTALEQKANAAEVNVQAENTEELRRKKIERAKYVGLFIFTAIPLPLTGCWTASVVASLLHLDYKKSLLFIVLGNVVAGAAITLLGGVLNIAFFR
ncbi:MAG: small multi-drug export protein [Clostridia bacterium]|nr:small multi-drug export protein [Clostridia bacterium]